MSLSQSFQRRCAPSLNPSHTGASAAGSLPSTSRTNHSRTRCNVIQSTACSNQYSIHHPQPLRKCATNAVVGVAQHVRRQFCTPPRIVRAWCPRRLLATSKHPVSAKPFHHPHLPVHGGRSSADQGCTDPTLPTAFHQSGSRQTALNHCTHRQLKVKGVELQP